jgi:hypothetical protein
MSQALLDPGMGVGSGLDRALHALGVWGTECNAPHGNLGDKRDVGLGDPSVEYGKRLSAPGGLGNRLGCSPGTNQESQILVNTILNKRYGG